LPFWFLANRRSRRFSFPVDGLYVAAEVGTIDLDLLALTTELVALDLGAIASRSLWASTKTVLYLHVQVTGECQRGLALHLVT